MVDDFAHHPTAVRETIKAARQKYPNQKVVAIFEPRSATSCAKIFEKSYQTAFVGADKVLFAPLGRALPENDRLDTDTIAQVLMENGQDARACHTYEHLRRELLSIDKDHVLLFMSNGDFNGLLKELVPR